MVVMVGSGDVRVVMMVTMVVGVDVRVVVMVVMVVVGDVSGGDGGNGGWW